MRDDGCCQMRADIKKFVFHLCWAPETALSQDVRTVAFFVDERLIKQWRLTWNRRLRIYTGLKKAATQNARYRNHVSLLVTIVLSISRRISIVVWYTIGLTSHSTQYRSFRRRGALSSDVHISFSNGGPAT